MTDAAPPLRILLVEDNPGDADLTREALEAGRLHFEISVAVDGAQALDVLLRRGEHERAETPDLVILDLNLPKLDGRSVLAELRAHEETRRLPVVVWTSSDAERDVAECYALGSNCYVTKPVELSEFVAAVRAIEEFWFGVAERPATR